MGQRLRRRPVLERRPADRVVVRARRTRTASSTAPLPPVSCGRGSRPARTARRTGPTACRSGRRRRGTRTPCRGCGRRRTRAPPGTARRRRTGRRVMLTCGLGVGGAAGGAGEQEAAAPLDAQRLVAAGEAGPVAVIRAVQIVSSLGSAALPPAVDELPLGVVEEVLPSAVGLKKRGSPPGRACSSRPPSRSGSAGAALAGGERRGRQRAVGRWRPAATAVALATFSAALVGSWASREVSPAARQVVLGRGVVVPVGPAAATASACSTMTGCCRPVVVTDQVADRGHRRSRW